MPFNFTTMLEFLSEKSKEEEIRELIDSKGTKINEVRQVI